MCQDLNPEPTAAGLPPQPPQAGETGRLPAAPPFCGAGLPPDVPPGETGPASETPSEPAGQTPTFQGQCAEAPEETPAPQSEEAAELANWKETLRADFEAWLGELEEVPAPEDALDEAPEEAPDLYSFFEQLAGANAEARKANRRTAEAISQWGETLARFDSSLEPLRESVAQLAVAQPKAGEFSLAHCLALVELLDRLQRIARAFRSPPPAKHSWLRRRPSAWPKAWDTQHQAFEIVLSHLEGLLKKEGVTRLEVLGQPFDPSHMTAVAAEPDAHCPAQTVLEELAPGYRRHGELLRPAQVKVSRKP